MRSPALKPAPKIPGVDVSWPQVLYPWGKCSEDPVGTPPPITTARPVLAASQPPLGVPSILVLTLPDCGFLLPSFSDCFMPRREVSPFLHQFCGPDLAPPFWALEPFAEPGW